MEIWLSNFTEEQFNTLFLLCFVLLPALLLTPLADKAFGGDVIDRIQDEVDAERIRIQIERREIELKELALLRGELERRETLNAANL